MTSPRAFLLAIGAGLLALFAALAIGAAWPNATSIKRAPSATAPANEIEMGRRYFAMSCAHCHGDDATGDEGPNLHKLKISDAHIALIVKNGIKGEMPTFAKKYDDAQIASLAAFLRSLE